jgi:hypothetical protein
MPSEICLFGSHLYPGVQVIKRIQDCDMIQCASIDMKLMWPFAMCFLFKVGVFAFLSDLGMLREGYAPLSGKNISPVHHVSISTIRDLFAILLFTSRSLIY